MAYFPCNNAKYAKIYHYKFDDAFREELAIIKDGETYYSYYLPQSSGSMAITTDYDDLQLPPRSGDYEGSYRSLKLLESSPYSKITWYYAAGLNSQGKIKWQIDDGPQQIWQDSAVSPSSNLELVHQPLICVQNRGETLKLFWYRINVSTYNKCDIIGICE